MTLPSSFDFLVSTTICWCIISAASAQEPTLSERPAFAEPVPSVFTEELTWEEVRDALKAGKTTILVPTGGVEQNGPYLITGKHNIIVRKISEAIARKLTDALVAPVVPFVPEGDIEPLTGHMRYPGTISVSEATFQALLTDICASYRAHGFLNIVLIGDSGGNQSGMDLVAKKLNKEWADGKTCVHYIPEYYDAAGVDDWLVELGIYEVDEGIHDSYVMSAVLAAIDLKWIRFEPRKAAGKMSINGVDLNPIEETAEIGRRLIEWYADTTVKAIHKSIASKRK